MVLWPTSRMAVKECQVIWLQKVPLPIVPGPSLRKVRTLRRIGWPRRRSASVRLRSSIGSSMVGLDIARLAILPVRAERAGGREIAIIAADLSWWKVGSFRSSLRPATNLGYQSPQLTSGSLQVGKATISWIPALRLKLSAGAQRSSQWMELSSQASRQRRGRWDCHSPRFNIDAGLIISRPISFNKMGNLCRSFAGTRRPTCRRSR